MPESMTIDFSQPVALFPLPNCVLLPHATIPLHIFEPRYRLMVADVLDTRRLIAMAMFDGDDWKYDYQGKPPIRSHVCVGHIVRHERIEDGRYNLLLQGVCRARIVREVPHDPYRLAHLEPTERRLPMEIEMDDARQRIESLLKEPLLRKLAAVSTIHNWLSAEIPTPVLVDLTTMSLCDNTEDRYRMLAEPDARSRARWLERLLRDTQRTLHIAERFTPEELPDQVHLN